MSRTIIAFFALLFVVGISFGQNVTLNGAGSFGGTWNIKGNINNGSATGTNTFSGTVNLNGSTAAQNIGSVAAAESLLIATLTATGTQDVEVQTTLAVSTAFTQNNGANFDVNAETVDFGGTTTVTTGTFVAADVSSVVNFMSGSAQTILSSTYGGTLGITGAGAKTLQGNVTAAIVTHSGAGLTLNDTLTINGSSPSTLAAITVDPTIQLENSGSSSVTIATLTDNNGIITNSSTGSIAFSGAVTNDGMISATDGGLTFADDVELASGSSLALSNDATASLAADLTNSGGGSASFGGTSVVTYNGTSPQSVFGTTYYDLTMSGAGQKNVAGTITLAASGTFDNGAATTDMSTFGFSLGGGNTLTQSTGTMKFGGANNGVVFTSGTVEYNGLIGVTQTIATGGTYAALSLTNGTGSGTANKEIAAAATVSVSGGLSLVSGVQLTLVNAASVLNVATSGTGDFDIAGALVNNGTINVGN